MLLSRELATGGGRIKTTTKKKLNPSWDRSVFHVSSPSLQACEPSVQGCGYR